MENDPEILEEKEPVDEPAPAKTASSSIAVTLTIVALILWFGFQAFQLMRDRGNLRLVKANQDAAMQESEKIRMQFQALMTKTAELAQQGQPAPNWSSMSCKEEASGWLPTKSRCHRRPARPIQNSRALT